MRVADYLMDNPIDIQKKGKQNVSFFSYRIFMNPKTRSSDCLKPRQIIYLIIIYYQYAIIS